MDSVREIDNRFVSNRIDVKLGQKRPEVMYGPGKKFDFSIIQVSEDKVMGMSSDHAFFMKALPPDKSAYITFHKAADKLSSSGILPEYLGLSLHLPPTLDEDTISHYWNSISIESKKFQVAITARSLSVSENAGEPFVGGLTFTGTSRRNFLVTPESAADGDRILMTKTAGLEAATVLSYLEPERIEKEVGEYNRKMAQKLFFKTSCLQEAQEALNFGLGKNGVTAMKAVSYTGILGAINEFTESGNFGADIEFDRIPVYDEVKGICSVYGFDPYVTASMGCMLITISPEAAEDFSKVLIGNGIDIADIGKVNRSSGVVRINGLTEREEERNSGRSFYNALP